MRFFLSTVGYEYLKLFTPNCGNKAKVAQKSVVDLYPTMETKQMLHINVVIELRVIFFLVSARDDQDQKHKRLNSGSPLDGFNDRRLFSSVIVGCMQNGDHKKLCRLKLKSVLFKPVGMMCVPWHACLACIWSFRDWITKPLFCDSTPFNLRNGSCEIEDYSNSNCSEKQQISMLHWFFVNYNHDRWQHTLTFI